MPSKREQVLSTLYNKLKSIGNIETTVYRNLDKPQKIPSYGIIILRDGNDQERETLLSPLTYIYEYLANIEVIVQNADLAQRNKMLDELLSKVGNVINNNRTLDDLAEWVEAKLIDFGDEAIEGAATIRIANRWGYDTFFLLQTLLN